MIVRIERGLWLTSRKLTIFSKALRTPHGWQQVGANVYMSTRRSCASRVSNLIRSTRLTGAVLFWRRIEPPLRNPGKELSRQALPIARGFAYVHGSTQQHPPLEAQLQATLNVIPRKRVEEQLVKSTQELKRSEAYLAEAQRLSHTGSFGWNPDTGEIVWSDETYRIFEYDRGTKPTLDVLVERLHPQNLTFFQQVINRASQTATDFEHEYRLLLPDGRVKHVHAIAHALQDASGNREFIGAVTDITERKTAEEKILCNERELRTLIDVMPAYVGTYLPDGTADLLSQSWLEYSGQTREEAMGWGWAGALHPDDADRVLANWRAGLDSGKPVEMEFRCRRADGTYRWFLNRNLPLRSDEGKIVKWYGILFDIDALKKTESALQMREHELLGIVETIPSMIVSISPSGEVTHLSQRHLEYFGARFEELTNRGWESFIHPDDREETAKSFFRSIEAGEPYNLINRLRRADGEYRWHHAMGEPLRVDPCKRTGSEEVVECSFAEFDGGRFVD